MLALSGTATGGLLALGGVALTALFGTLTSWAQRRQAEELARRMRTDRFNDEQRSIIIELQDRFAELLVDCEALARAAHEARLRIAGRTLQFDDIANWDRVLLDYSRCNTLRTRLGDEELRRLAAIGIASAGRIVHDPVRADPDLILPASDAVDAFNARCIVVFATLRSS